MKKVKIDLTMVSGKSHSFVVETEHSSLFNMMKLFSSDNYLVASPIDSAVTYIITANIETVTLNWYVEPKKRTRKKKATTQTAMPL
jgi:hypothetical protein